MKTLFCPEAYKCTSGDEAESTDITCLVQQIQTELGCSVPMQK